MFVEQLCQGLQNVLLISFLLLFFTVRNVFLVFDFPIWYLINFLKHFWFRIYGLVLIVNNSVSWKFMCVIKLSTYRGFQNTNSLCARKLCIGSLFLKRSWGKKPKDLFFFLADPGKAMGFSTNTSITN